MKFHQLKKAIFTLVLMAFFVSSVESQEQKFAIAVYGSVTSSSRLFYSPNDADEISRNQSLSLDGVFGIGIDIRRSVKGDELFIGLGSEYLSAKKEFSLQQANGVNVQISDGYVAVPVELTGYFTIPISTGNFRMYLGGGIGIYFGERRYTYAMIPSHITERKTGFGIHVLSGAEFDISNLIVLRTELKFREVQFESTNIFDNTQQYPGISFPYTVPFVSRISIDGIVVHAGAAFRF